MAHDRRLTVGEQRHIRSFHVVFSLERRIHRIDQFRIPLPYGLPLRSIGYAGCLLAILTAAARLPGIGAVVGGLPLPVRYLVLPLAGAVALTQVRIDGRAAGAAGLAAARHLAAPKTIARWTQARIETVRFADVTVTPDGAGPLLRRGHLPGPSVVHLRDAVVTRRGRRRIVVSHEPDAAGAGEPVLVHRRERLVVR